MLIFVTVLTEIWAIVKYVTVTEPPLATLETLKQSLVNEDKHDFWNNTLTSVNISNYVMVYFCFNFFYIKFQICMIFLTDFCVIFSS